MAKTNYTKVEAALDAAFLDRRAKELAFLADFYHRPVKAQSICGSARSA